MKKKINRDIVILFIIIPIFLWLAFNISSLTGKGLPNYSVINKSKYGLSVMYDTLKLLKYPVDRTVRPLDEFDRRDVQIVPDSMQFDINSDEVKSWIKNGGILVYLKSDEDIILGYGTPKVNLHTKIYEYYKGAMITCNVDDITNKAMLKNTDTAYELLRKIDNYDYNEITFNENGLFASSDSKSFWDYIPVQFKYFIYEIGIIILAFIYYLGKRFGKPQVEYDEVERTENEYIYSAAAVYKEAGCFDIMLENYYTSFLKRMGLSHEKWLEYWKSESMPEFEKAKKVYEFIELENRGSKHKNKQYLEIIAIIDKLKSIVDKRRDLYWKTIRKM